MSSSSAGSSPKSTSKNSSCGTYLPSTTRHTVSGLDKTRPIGPHKKPQNTAASTVATTETPMLMPYNQGSMMLLLTSSSTIKKPMTASGGHQLGNWTTLRAIGRMAATGAPMYGTYRSTAARKPQSKAWFTPMRYSPIPHARP